MSGRAIQGFFVGGGLLAPAAPPRPVPVQRLAVQGPPRAMPGPPAPAFARAAGQPVQQRAAHLPAGPVQRSGGDGSFPIDSGRIGLARGGGMPLPGMLLAKMEAAFGADFASVRVHVGPQASRIGALAFTTGNDLYFAPGQYQPNSVRGQQLIGHELAHVLQQRQGRVRAPGSGLAVVQDRALEAEADRLGMRAAMQCAPLQAKAQRPTPAGSGRQGVRVPGHAVQPMMSWLAEKTASDLPKGIELRKSFGGGFRTGYSPEAQTLGLYDRKARLLAHVHIQTGRVGAPILLHTRTDSGAVGGQGYMAMFTDVLRVIRRDFYDPGGEIWMGAAPGAATKGLISELARMRQRIQGPPRNMLSGARRMMGNRFLENAQKLREARQLRGAKGPKVALGPQEMEKRAQAWNGEAMLETAWELNAIAEFERASPTGLSVTGSNARFNEVLVGPDAPALPGGALAWHQASAVDNPGTLILKFSMARLDDYIAVLPD